MKGRFKCLQGLTLTQEDFNIPEKVILIKDFLFLNDMNIVYSAPKQGKSWLAYAICKYLSKSKLIEDILYMDMDNPVGQLKARKVDKKMMSIPKIEYLSKAKLNVSPMEMLKSMAKESTLGTLTDFVLIIDTIKDFIDFNNAKQAQMFMGYCVQLRDAGATIIILHHTTKQERGISGDQIFINTPDNIFELKQKSRVENTLNYELRATHTRGLVTDCKYAVDTATLELSKYNAMDTGLTDADRAYVEKGIKSLREASDGLSESALVLGMGFTTRTDRNGKRLANEMINHYWRKKEINPKLSRYYIMEEKNEKID